MDRVTPKGGFTPREKSLHQVIDEQQKRDEKLAKRYLCHCYSWKMAALRFAIFVAGELLYRYQSPPQCKK